MSSHSDMAAGRPRPDSALPPAPYTSRYVDAGGLRLNLLDYGSEGRPPMLCVHGGGAHAHWYDFIASGFNADHHVQALDLRGHGDSEWADAASYTFQRHAQDVAEAVEKLGLRDFILIGHSMGGMVSLLYAATYPGRVAKLVIVDTTMNMTEERVASLRSVGAREATAYATREEFERRFRLRPAGTTASARVIAHVAAHSGRQAGDGTWRHKFDRGVYARRVGLDGRPCWDRIGIPALLIKGGISGRVTDAIAADVKARCPQLEIAEVPNADHHVTLDNPEGFVRVVRDFLSRNAGRPAGGS